MNAPLTVACACLLGAGSLFAQDRGSSFGQARSRELADLGRLPTTADVVVADIVNYRRHRLPLPRAGQAVALDVRCGGAVDPDGDLVVQIGYTTTPTDDRTELPPLDLALVIDVSGSMADAGKLDAVKRGLDAFVGQLRPQDEVALVTFDSTARVVESRRRRGDGDWLRTAIRGLEPGSSTNLHDGLMLGLREVGDHPRPGANHRVILLTDGIANQGVTEPAAILADARRYTDADVDLSTIGLGRDLNTDLLAQLARGGRGLFHFVASAADVDKVFVKESESLVAIAARDVRLRLDLPTGMRVQRVFGHEYRADGNGLTVELPNLNAGVTGVVMLTCRHHGDDGRLRARLGYRDRKGGDRDVVADAEVPADDRARDAEVKKNFTIAVLADGLHAMAAAAERQRWADADRSLRLALSYAREQFPSDEDEDIRRVRSLAEDHQRTLRRYVDRFRDY